MMLFFLKKNKGSYGKKEISEKWYYPLKQNKTRTVIVQLVNRLSQP